MGRLREYVKNDCYVTPLLWQFMHYVVDLVLPEKNACIFLFNILSPFIKLCLGCYYVNLSNNKSKNY